MPKAKHILTHPVVTNVPKATDTFTDRLEPRKAFHDLVRKARSEEFENYYVIDYYGIGGVGKTTLLAQLRKEAAGQYGKGRTKAVVLHINFESVVPDRAEVMAELRNQFKAQTGADMTDFDACLERLSELIHIETEKKEKASILTRNKWVSAALDVGGYIPVVNTVLSKGTGLIKTGEKIYNAISSKVNDVHAGTMGDSIPLLLDNLPLYFSRDVSKYCETEEDVILFLFVDTYERLTAAAEGNTRASRSAEWLWGSNGLFENLPNAVIAIAGREKLAFEPGEDGVWSKRVETHLLNHLSETDSCEYLAKCGIMQEALRHELYGLTGGEPVYLDLCVSRYYQLIRENREPVISEFGLDTEDLVERHLRYIEQDIWDAIYLCALLLRWNDDLMFRVAERIPLYIQPSQKEIIYTLTYVSTENGTACMHQVVADVLAKRFPAGSRGKLLEPLLEYGESHPDDLLWGNAAVRVCTVCGLYEKLPQVVSLYAASLMRAERFDETIRMAENAWQLCRQNGLTDSPAYWNIKETLGIAYQNAGMPENAVTEYSQLLALRKEALGEGHEDTVRAGRLLADAYEDGGDKERTTDELERLLPKAEESLGNRHAEVTAIREALARLYKNRGAPQKAIPFARSLLETQIEENGYGSFETRYCMGMLFGLYEKLGETEKALSIYRTAFEREREKYGINNRRTLLAMNDLAGRYSKTGRAAEAVSLLETEWKLRQEMNDGEESGAFDTAAQFAAALAAAGENNRAAQMYETVLAERRKTAGTADAETLAVMAELSCLYAGNGHAEKAEALDEEALDTVRLLLKDGDTDTAEFLADYYEESGRKEVADKIRQTENGEKTEV